MDVDETLDDVIMKDCLHKNCDCEDNILQLKHFKQGKHGTCWFVSMLNMLCMSDSIASILHPYLQSTSLLKACDDPDLVVQHLLKDVKDQVCLPPDRANIIDIIDLKQARDNVRIFRAIFQEFISKENSPCYFGCEDSITGGLPQNIIIPYLLRLGYPLCNMKQVLLNLDNITVQLGIQSSTDPRQLKINRLCQEYLKTLHVLYEEDTNLFVLTINQSDKGMLNDIFHKRAHLFLAKYICYILDTKNGKKQLVIYTLDGGFLISNNNTGRHSAHALCMLTCNQKGYIVNSYDPSSNDKGRIDTIKSCSIYQYDWYKWINEDYYHHSIESDNTCRDGKMIVHSDAASSVFVTVDNTFTYHRNIGNNSFVYAKEVESYTPVAELENMHYGRYPYWNDSHEEAYNEFLKPYLYLIYFMTNKMGINNVMIKYDSYVPNILMNTNGITVIQKGIVSNGMNVFGYSIKCDVRDHNEIAKIIYDCLPDDITIIQDQVNPSQFAFFIEYFRQSNPLPLLPTHGG